jgi:hypothetical protein
MQSRLFLKVRAGSASHRAPSVPARQTPAGVTGAQTVGKYLVSPLIKILEDGWFASSVSIRSGSGSGTTDRVLRLRQIFGTAEEAAACAHAEALSWIREAGGQRIASHA